MSAGRAPGEWVTESVRLERPIGGGAMGDVWLARHQALGAEVVVKLLRRGDVGPEGEARFAQEARTIARLGSPYVVQVFDLGTTAGGQPFIVMELLRGEELKSRIEREGKLSLDDTVTLVTQLCRALARAHELGVVHRDIKPANLFLVEAGGALHLKVLDFGVAKVLHGDLDMTATGTLLGTPYYMSPEQLLQPRLVDHRADLWATAVVAYACLAGALPFHGDTLGALSVAVHAGDFRPLAELRPELPAALDAWMKRALRPRLEERFGDAAALAESFARAARAAEEDAPMEMTGEVKALAPERAVEGLAARVDVAPALDTMLTAATPSKRVSARGVPRWVAALLGAVAVVAVAAMWSARSTPSREAAAPSATTAAVVPAALAPAGKQQTCPNCGAANGPDNRFCRECGAELSARQSEPKPANAGAVIELTAFYPTVEAAARGKRADAVLDSITLVPVPEDGRLIEGEVKLVFVFHSKSADACLYLWGATRQLQFEERACETTPAPAPAPRCSPAEVRERLAAKVSPGEATLTYRGAAGKGLWEVHQKTPTPAALVDDC
jgi:serine/threonine-protein kinase